MGILSLLTTFLLLLLTLTSSTDLSTLVYKGCANQTFSSGGGVGPSALAALASSLAAQSSSSKFFKTTTSAASGGQSLFGLFQCRGDLSPSDCASCVSAAFPMWNTLCGTAVAARIQLTGCYALYQVSGFPQTSGTQMLFKSCSSGGGGSDFEVKRDTAFANLENGIAGGGGFFATGYQGVYAVAQCEGDLSTADCNECVAEAVQRSEVECGGAGFGQVYLDKCYISYNSGGSHGGGGGGGSGGGGGGGFGGGQQTGKTVAIVVGGAAGLGFVVICLLFARSLFRKKDDF